MPYHSSYKQSFMAHKKKKKVSGHRRRKSRVGAIKPGSIEHYLLLGVGGILGGVAGAYAVNAANIGLTSVVASTPRLPPAAVAGAGLGIAVLSKGNALGTGFGVGMGAIGGVMVANQTFLNVPGISGMSMKSNAGETSNVIRKAVGQGPKNYINQTVGAMHRNRRVGALGTN
jgi:hypothetical protein